MPRHTRKCRCPRILLGLRRDRPRAVAGRETPVASGRGPGSPTSVNASSPPSRPVRTASATGIAGIAPPNSRAVDSAVRNMSGPATGRAASWMSTTSMDPDSMSAARCRNTLNSDACRLSPPSTNSTVAEGSSRLTRVTCQLMFTAPEHQHGAGDAGYPCQRVERPGHHGAAGHPQIGLVAVGADPRPHTGCEHDADGVGPRRRAHRCILSLRDTR